MGNNRISTFLTRLVRFLLFTGVLAVVPSALAVICSYPSRYPDVLTFGETPLIVLGALAEAALIWGLGRAAGHPRMLLCASFAWLNVAAVYILLTVPTEPVSDYKTIWDMACGMADGTYRASRMPIYAYAYFNNYQHGIAMIESWVIGIFGKSFAALQALTLVALNVTAGMVYLLGRRVLTRQAAAQAVALFVTFYPVVITVGQFTNQHLAAPVILGIVLLLGRRKIPAWCAAGILSGCMAFIRPMMVLTFLTMLVWAVFLLFRDRREWRRILLCGLLFTLCQSGVTALGDALMHRADILPEGSITVTHYPYFKFEKGLLGYEMPDWAGIHSTEEFNRLERERIATALTERPGEVGRYAVTKMIRYLGEFDYKVENTYNHDKALWGRQPVKGFILFGWGQYLALAVAAAVYLLRVWRRFELRPWHIFYVGNLYVYFLIEAFSTYRYESYPFLIVMAAGALLAGDTGRTERLSVRDM